MGKINSIRRSLSTGTQRNGGDSSLNIDLLAGGSNCSGTPVDTNSNIPNQPIKKGLTKQLGRNNSIIAISIGSGVKRILGVKSAVQSSQMRMVRTQLIDGINKLLREEQLTDMLGCCGRVARVIFVNLGLHSDVNVGSAGGVVAWEDSEELADSGLVRLGDSAQEGGVVSCAIGSCGPAIVCLDGVGVDADVAGVTSSSVAGL